MFVQPSPDYAVTGIVQWAVEKGKKEKKDEEEDRTQVYCYTNMTEQVIKHDLRTQLTSMIFSQA